MPQRLTTAARALTGSGVKLCSENTLDMLFLAYYGCSKLLKARVVFYWGTLTRFTVSVGIDPSLTIKTRRTRSADCICMDKSSNLVPLWEIVYYSDTCIVYLAVREALLRFYGISHACANSGAQALPRKKRLDHEVMGPF